MVQPSPWKWGGGAGTGAEISRFRAITEDTHDFRLPFEFFFEASEEIVDAFDQAVQRGEHSFTVLFSYRGGGGGRQGQEMARRGVPWSGAGVRVSWEHLATGIEAAVGIFLCRTGSWM